MSSRSRKAWFALACLVAATFFWTSRREYLACDTDGCVVVNRWTGSIVFAPAEATEEPPPEGGVVVRRGDSRPRAPTGAVAPVVLHRVLHPRSGALR